MTPPIQDATLFTGLDGARYRLRVERLGEGEPEFSYRHENLPLPVPPPSPPLTWGRPSRLPEKFQTPQQKQIPGSERELVDPSPPRRYPDSTIMQHPLLGGRFTICVLCFGRYEQLHRRCIDSILTTVPPECRDLRVGANQVQESSLTWLRALRDQGTITKLYESPVNLLKYPMMRQMYHDPACPITTPYVVWFDDDSWAKPGWFVNLGDTIVANHPHGAALYGIRFVHDLNPLIRHGKRPDLWLKQAPWWRGRSLSNRRGDETPNGSFIIFVSGGCHAISTEAIKVADVPDVRLKNNGGDILIGEQLHQAGFKVKLWNAKKAFVQSSDHDRRGVTTSFPWAV